MQNLSAKNVGSLARSLGADLLAANKKVASVESCTGGGVAYAITEVAGSSQWFEKSWVTYSNQAKHEEVGVKLDTLAKFGAVSSEVVREMAEGGLHKSGADLCVSISGIAGPGGGSPSKPVGLVWFAIAMLEVKPEDEETAVLKSSAVIKDDALLDDSSLLKDNVSPQESSAFKGKAVLKETPAFKDNSTLNEKTIIKDNITYSVTTRCFSRCFSGDRQQVREQAIHLALKELIVSLVNS
ncbi:CinA family protein [Glaciecola sp. MF2-115]|uniref:CinA family protein n=1 Tax=Glaciecola sp. MF2-115 TaxID=3384827 RepID=UPI0039A14C47